MCAEQEFEHACTCRMDMNVCRMWIQMHIQGVEMVTRVYRHVCVLEVVSKVVVSK